MRRVDSDVAVSQERRPDQFLNELAAPGVAASRAAAALAALALGLLLVGCWSLFKAMTLSDLPGIALRLAVGATHTRIAVKANQAGS